MRELLSFCEAEQPWLLETIRALATIESPTHTKAAVDACGRELERRLQAIGARVTRIPQEAVGDHLRAEFPSTSLGAGSSSSLGTSGSGSSQILMLGHFDTVWDVGQIRMMPVKEIDGRLHGPGVFDMKAGIALGMLAARALVHDALSPKPQALSPPPQALSPKPFRLVMLWTTDEETGSDTSRAVLEEEARRSEAVLVLEPSLPGGALKTGRKGCGDFELVVRGVSAHAGIDPSKGASAIRELARQILKIEQLQDPARGVTVNVGVVRGGTRANVVADEARALIDVRVGSMADAQRVYAALAALRPEIPGTSLELHGGIDRPPLERTDGVLRLYHTAREVAAELGRDLGEGTTGGGSDGNFTAALNVPTLDGLGAVGDGAHALHEHVVVGDLPWRAALLAGLVKRLSSAF
jgi:glutamate carboxypeptidase